MARISGALLGDRLAPAPRLGRYRPRYQLLRHRRLAGHRSRRRSRSSSRTSTTRALRYRAQRGLDRRYDKIHLVPFGEYVPFKNCSASRRLDPADRNVRARQTACSLIVGDSQAGVFICYESDLPQRCRQFALHGAEFFVNISNDGWYGEGGAPRQHLNMARMRAVENNRWLLREQTPA